MDSIFHNPYRRHNACDSTLTRKVMMMTVKYKEIKVQLIGNDGNAFAIMGTVSKALKQANIPQEDIDAYLQESMSGDYDNLLRTAMKYVEVS